MSESYHVFVHIIDESGNLVAQSDGEPAGWTRPTTGWLPGEYISDNHEIVLPIDVMPGFYNIYAGLYNNFCHLFDRIGIQILKYLGSFRQMFKNVTHFLLSFKVFGSKHFFISHTLLHISHISHLKFHSIRSILHVSQFQKKKDLRTCAKNGRRSVSIG